MPPCRMWLPTVLPSAGRKGASSSSRPYRSYGDAAPCHRAGGGYLQGSHQRVRKRGQQHKQALRLLREVQRRALVPEVAICGAALSACEKGQQHQQALHLLRAVRRQAIVPDVVAYGAAISGCGSSSSTSRRYFSYERCGAMPLRRLWATALRYPGIVPVVSARGAADRACARGQRGQQALQPRRAMRHHDFAPEVPAAPAGLSSRASVAAPCHRAGCVCMYGAAISVGERASSTSGPYLTCERCSALPSCWV